MICDNDYDMAWRLCYLRECSDSLTVGDGAVSLTQCMARLIYCWVHSNLQYVAFKLNDKIIFVCSG